MNGASKILTVSYGTFSCTLEGFDDPFNTMKAIAEYFRDLAADDRYFGAEPPTPDAAMLHRIAEREIQRRVEAKVGEHGVVLRAGEAQAAQEPAPVAAVAASAAPAPVAPQAEAPQPVLASPSEAAPAVESAAARLLRLRAAQAQLQAQVQVQPTPPVATPAPTPDAEAYAEDQEPAPAIASIPPQAIVEEVETEAALDRVLAAVQDRPAAPAEEAQDDLPVLTSLRETLAGLMSQDEQLAADMAEAEAAAPVVVTEEFSLPEEEPEVEIEIEDLANPVEDTEVEAEEAPLAEIVEEVIIDDAAYVEDAEPVAASAEVALAEEGAQPDVVIDAEAPVVTEKLQRARARVIKIRRLDKREKAPEVLSAEDEADLANTLAALEAETAPVEAAAQAEIIAQAPAAQAEPAPLPPAAAEASVERILAEANQKLEVPEVKRRRSAIAHLKAAVLATVADRRANPKAQAAQTEAKADPYRQDLDKVVRPMTSAQLGERPAPLVLVSAQRIDRKPELDANRPMPQIVSSTPAPVAGALSVRPRRVTAGGAAQAATQADDDADEDFVEPVDLNGKQSFAEFAESLGAASLSELLEAAAAYCTLVLDRPSFSRPLLFQQVTQLPTMAETKREDSLRNFGKLLRDGRFQKTARGQFALADTSPILSEAKRLAG